MQRKQALADRLREVLDEATAERRTIDEALAKILADAQTMDTPVLS